MTKAKAVAQATQDIPEAGDLQAVNDALANQAELLAQFDEKLATLEAENAALKQVIAELNEELDAKDTQIQMTSSRPILKHGGDIYELRFPKFTFRYNGKPLKVDETSLRNDPQLLAAVIAKNSNALIKKGGK
jgi:hypothetical protein